MRPWCQRGDVAVGRLPTYQVPLVADGTAPLTELKSLVALIGLFRQVQPRIVLGFTPKGNIYAGLAARATGRPFLPNVSGLGTGFIRGGLLLKVQAALYREAFRGLPIVFFQNRDDAALFEKMGLVRREQVQLIPGSGVDCRAFAAAIAQGPAERSAPTAVRRAAAWRQGRSRTRRGDAAAPSALSQARHSPSSANLARRTGRPSRQDELDGWVREGLLTHAGHTKDVRPFIAAADAVILPSYREGMPRALLEAAAMARPLLAADVPGCREIVRDGVNGLLFEVRSPQAHCRRHRAPDRRRPRAAPHLGQERPRHRRTANMTSGW